MGGIMVVMLASIVVDRGFEPWSGQTKNYKIGICCFSTKHSALRSKNKDLLAWNHENAELALNNNHSLTLLQDKYMYMEYVNNLCFGILSFEPNKQMITR